MTFPAPSVLCSTLAAGALATALLSCQQAPAPAPPKAPAATIVAVDGPDPGAVDEALRAALIDVRDRFKCNRISGCKSHDVLVGFGWRARPFLQQVLEAAPPRAPWRPRLVRILAELGDPVAAPTFRQALRDRTDEVRGYAIYGLHRLGDRSEHEEIIRFARRAGPFASACARLSARWILFADGERDFGPLFVEELRIRASQSLASVPVAWGLHLCGLAGSPDCEPVLALASRHPTFVVRRAALDLLERSPKPEHLPILQGLLADPIPSLGRRARVLMGKLKASGAPAGSNTAGRRGLGTTQNR
jgi:HEAT repeat protein